MLFAPSIVPNYKAPGRIVEQHLTDRIYSRFTNFTRVGAAANSG